MQVFNYSELRTDLKKIVDSVAQGMVAVIHTKGRKVAIVPIRMMHELESLREAQRSRADTKVEDVPRTEALPSEVPAEDAHSSRAAELAEAFEVPPSDMDDDHYEEPTDEDLDAMQAALLEGLD